MNKAYIDLLVSSDANAVLVYLPDNPVPANNLLGTKFPQGDYEEYQIWGKSYHHENGNQLIVWFSDGIYSHSELIADLQMVDYTVIHLDKAFNQFPEMQEYIEENQL